MFVFLSYPHADNDEFQDVSDFARGLRQEIVMRISPSFVYQAGEGGPVVGNLRDALRSKLRQADVYMPLLAPAFFASHWCTHEFQMYKEEKKLQNQPLKIAPVLWLPFDALAFARGNNMLEIADAAYFDWATHRLTGHKSPESRLALSHFVDSLCEAF